MYRRAYSELKSDEKYIQIGKSLASAFPLLLQAEGSTSSGQHGCLFAIENFAAIVCNDKLHRLENADQAREFIRYLVAEKAFSRDTAKSKREIEKHLLGRKLIARGVNWRPHSPFKGTLRQLRHDAIDSDKHKGIYWIKP